MKGHIETTKVPDMLYTSIAIYLFIALIFFIIGLLTTDDKVSNKPLALLAAIVWPLSVAAVSAHIIYDRMMNAREKLN